MVVDFITVLMYLFKLSILQEERDSALSKFIAPFLHGSDVRPRTSDTVGKTFHYSAFPNATLIIALDVPQGSTE